MKRAAWLGTIGVVAVLLCWGLEAVGRRAHTPVPSGEPSAARPAATSELSGARARPEPILPGAPGAGLDPGPAAARQPLDLARGDEPVRGRAVDAASGQPLGAAFALELRSADGSRLERVPLDVGGGFCSTRPFEAGRLRAGLFERHENAVIASRSIAHDGRDEALLLGFDVGLLVHLDLRLPEALTPTSARARVVVGAGEDERGWAWDQLRPMTDACLHYARPPVVEDPQAPIVVEVELTAPPETLHGRAPLSAARGVLGPITVDLQPETRAGGRVVDAAGEALPDVTVVLLPDRGPEDPGRRPAGIPTARTREGGAFVLEGLEPGPQRLSLYRGLTAVTALPVVLEAGWNDLGDVRLEVPFEAGFVRGRVTDHGDGKGLVALVLADSTSGERWFSSTTWNLFGSEGEGEFAFEGVPPGEYELRPVNAGVSYRPQALRVSPPAEGLSFEVDRERPEERVVIEARDARSGERLSELQFLCRFEGLWFGGDGLKSGAPTPVLGDRWILWATGHRPVFLDRPGPERFEPHGDSELRAVIEVELEPGWTRAFIAIDGGSPRSDMGGDYEPFFGRRLAGLEVWASGHRLGTTDAEGLALLVEERDPGPLELRLAGWRVLTRVPSGQVVMVVLGRE